MRNIIEIIELVILLWPLIVKIMEIIKDWEQRRKALEFVANAIAGIFKQEHPTKEGALEVIANALSDVFKDKVAV